MFMLKQSTVWSLVLWAVVNFWDTTGTAYPIGESDTELLGNSLMEFVEFSGNNDVQSEGRSALKLMNVATVGSIKGQFEGKGVPQAFIPGYPKLWEVNPRSGKYDIPLVGVEPYIDVSCETIVYGLTRMFNLETNLNMSWHRRGISNTTREYVRVMEGDMFFAVLGSTPESYVLLEPNCDYSVVAHELLHVIGLSHEFNRKDRYEYLMKGCRDADVNREEYKMATPFDLLSITNYYTIVRACVTPEYAHYISRPFSLPAVPSSCDWNLVNIAYPGAVPPTPCQQHSRHLVDIFRPRASVFRNRLAKRLAAPKDQGSGRNEIIDNVVQELLEYCNTAGELVVADDCERNVLHRRAAAPWPIQNVYILALLHYIRQIIADPTALPLSFYSLLAGNGNLERPKSIGDIDIWIRNFYGPNIKRPPSRLPLQVGRRMFEENWTSLSGPDTETE